MATLEQAIGRGATGARPAADASKIGRLYADTTTGKLYRDNGVSWDEVASDLALGTTSTTAAAGTDARLSDARTPTGHHASHNTGGGDAIAPADIGAQPADADLTAIAALTPANDDVAQRKAGAWTNRTLAQLIADLIAVGVWTEAVQDVIGAMVAAAGGTYNDAAGTITLPSGGGAALTVEEVDGTPTVAATKLVLPNGTLGVVGTVATYTPAAGGGGGGFPNPMLAAGDIIIGGASTTANQALATVGASATQSSTAGGAASNMIDANNSTKAEGSGPVAGSWKRIDLGSAKAIVSLQLKQETAGGAWRATSFNVAYSPDNATWTTTQTVACGDVADTGEIPIAGGPITARYWRIDALAGGSNGWNVFTLAFSTGLPPGTPIRLAKGTDGQVLKLVSGMPAWVTS